MKMDKVEAMAKKHIDGHMAMQILRFTELNPEQKLACVLEQLIVAGKAKLELLEICNGLAKECIEWRKTPEGVAWAEKQAEKRAAKTDA